MKVTRNFFLRTCADIFKVSIDHTGIANDRASTCPLDAEVSAALQRLTQSQPLVRSERLCSFLRYIVTETLAGRGDKIIGYTVGIDVFARPESFDPSVDTIVRVEAGRLRRSLDQYYREEGADDPVEILVPKGTYVPDFRYRSGNRAISAQVNAPNERQALAAETRGPSISVLPFANYSGDPNDQFFADGLTEETIANLARFKDLFVFSRSTMSALAREGANIRQLRDELGVDFVVEGSVRKTPQMVRVTVQLIDAATDGHILSESFDRACTPEGVFEIQDEIARLVAGRVADRHGPLGRYIQRARRPGASQSWDTYNWIARFYDYYAKHDPEQHAEVRDGLEQALDHDQDSSDGWAALSLIVLDEYRLHMNERHNFPAVETSLQYAQRAVTADPENAFAYQALALAYFYNWELREFQIAADRAIELNPGHADVLADVAFCYAHLGNWEMALPLAQRAIELSPVHPGWYRWAGALHCLVNDDHQGALIEFKKGAVPGLFWYHAYVAALHAMLGEDDKATAEVRELLRIYPDFPQHVRHECERLSKPVEWTTRLVDGLRKAGLHIA